MSCGTCGKIQHLRYTVAHLEDTRQYLENMRQNQEKERVQRIISCKNMIIKSYFRKKHNNEMLKQQQQEKAERHRLKNIEKRERNLLYVLK